MALLGSINKISGLIGTGLTVIDSLFQKQVTIRNVDDEDDTVVLNVTDSEQLEFLVNITEKPVANLGAATDYVSRTATPLTLTGQISNRTLDLGQDPFEYLIEHAAGIIPGIANVLNVGVSLASEFFDLGRDEIDRKMSTLLKWQLNAVVVEILGLRLDANKITPLPETFNFLIEQFTPLTNLDAGDNVEFTLVLKNFLHIQEPVSSVKRGSSLTDKITGALNVPNPF